MTTKIYATGDERFTVDAFAGGIDRGKMIQFACGKEGYEQLTLEEAEALCIRLAAYLGGARDVTPDPMPEPGSRPPE